MKTRCKIVIDHDQGRSRGNSVVLYPERAGVTFIVLLIDIRVETHLQGRPSLCGKDRDSMSDKVVSMSRSNGSILRVASSRAYGGKAWQGRKAQVTSHEVGH